MPHSSRRSFLSSAGGGALAAAGSLLPSRVSAFSCPSFCALDSWDSAHVDRALWSLLSKHGAIHANRAISGTCTDADFYHLGVLTVAMGEHLHEHGFTPVASKWILDNYTGLKTGCLPPGGADAVYKAVSGAGVKTDLTSVTTCLVNAAKNVGRISSGLQKFKSTPDAAYESLATGAYGLVKAASKMPSGDDISRLRWPHAPHLEPALLILEPYDPYGVAPSSGWDWPTLCFYMFWLGLFVAIASIPITITLPPVGLPIAIFGIGLSVASALIPGCVS